MALSRDIVLRLLGDSTSAQKALKDAADAAEVTVANYRKAEREQDRQNGAMQKAAAAQSAAHRQMGIAAVAMGAAVGLGLGVAVKAAIDWESAWAGVAKTVEGTPQQMAALEQSLRGLALILPVTHQEIAAVAEAAGQLGIARADLAAFTATAIALGETTNLSATDAATGLAQLSNVMGTSADDTDRLGSALVALGNNGASTEADILSMAQRIAGAGQQIGLSEGEVLGLASALSSVGIEAEAGGSAISRVMIDMATAVDAGGEQMERFAAVAGVSGAEFTRMFRDDAAGALAAFVTGLGQVEAKGGSTFQVLDELGFSEIRVRDALLRASSASDILTSSLAMGNAAWGENSALLEEAAKRYATTESQLAMARNALVDAGIDIGNTLIPVLLSLGQVLQGLIGWWQDLPGPIKDVVAALAGVAAVGAIAGGGLTVAKAKMAEFGAAATAAGGHVSGFGKAASGALGFVGGPWGIALGAAAVVGSLAAESGEAAANVRELTAAIEADSGALGENTRMALVKQLADEGMLDNARTLGISLEDLTDSLLGNSDAQARVNAAVEAAAPALQVMNPAMTEAELASLALSAALGDTSSELDAARTAYENQQEALGGAAAASEGAASAAEVMGSAVGTAAAETELLTEKADALKAALDTLSGAFVTSLEANAAYEATLDTMDQALVELGLAVVNADGSLTALGVVSLNSAGQIDVSSEAGRRLQGEFVNLRNAGNEVIDSLVRQGDTQGALAADQRLRNDFISKANAAGIFGQDADNLANSILGIPTQRHTEISTTAAEAAAGVQNLYNKIAGLNDREIYVTTHYTETRQTNYLTQGISAGKAYGGRITGVGGPRQDNILTPTSVGEFVEPVDAVQYYGLPFMEAIRTKRLPRMGEGMAFGGGIGAGMAAGGQVGSSAPVVNVSIDYGRLGSEIAAVLDDRPLHANLLVNLDGRVVAESTNRLNARNSVR